MIQAATLTQQQLQRVLEYTRTRRHYKRNRAIILLTHYAMLRVGEVAALRYCDVLEADGQIKAETTLTAAQTKGKKGRKIWFSEKVRAERWREEQEKETRQKEERLIAAPSPHVRPTRRSPPSGFHRRL